MNITENIIITDTNIITDLDIALVLEDFVKLKNVYISDLIKHNEINEKSGNLEIIQKFKTIEATSKQIYEMQILSLIEPKLSIYDLINYITARDNNFILATGDKHLYEYSEKNNVKVIRVIKIIELLSEQKIIDKNKEMQAFVNLYNSKKTRLPKDELLKRIEKLKKELIFV